MGVIPPYLKIHFPTDVARLSCSHNGFVKGAHFLEIYGNLDFEKRNVSDFIKYVGSELEYKFTILTKFMIMGHCVVKITLN